MTRLRKVQIYITHQQHLELNRQAVALGVTFSEAARRVLDAGLKREKK